PGARPSRRGRGVGSFHFSVKPAPPCASLGCGRSTCYGKGPMEISFDEKFALAQDRKQVLQQLIPGTEDYYYYHCLYLEQQGQRDEGRKFLETWVQRHGWTARAIE